MSAMVEKVIREGRVIELAAAQAGMTPESVSLDSRLREDLNYDSLDAVEFIMTIEDEFDVSVPDEMAETVKTVGDAVTLLRSVRTASPN